MTILSKAIYRSKAVPVKILNAFSHRTRIIVKHVWNQKKTSNNQSYLEKGEQWFPLFSKYMTKPWSSKQYGTGPQTDTEINERD